MKVARDSLLTSGLRSGCWRRGSSLLEVQIAFALLGIGLAGLCPFVVMQLRQLSSIESRLKASTYVYHNVGMATSTVQSNPNQVYYLVPWNNPWARKLTTRAQLLTAGSNLSDLLTITTPSVTHVTLPQAVSLTLDGNGNVTKVTAVVQVN
jgi:Tfp pilus assembly protein PilV